MASMGEEPWQESEKLYLLAEILKDAQIPAGVFLGIIMDAQIDPRWDEIPLPPGRSLRSCQNAFHYLLADPSIPMSRSQPLMSSGPKHINPRKRPLPPKDSSTPGARSLQPRPPTMQAMNGNEGSPFQFSTNEDPTQPPKKKRGRPSKADQEARAAAAAARGEPYPASKNAQTPKSAKAVGGGKGSAAKAGSAQAQRAVGGGHAPTAVMMTPGGRGTESGTPGTGSAPRPRRGRPTKAESQAKRILLEAAAAAGHDNPNNRVAQEGPRGATGGGGGYHLPGAPGDPSGHGMHDPFGRHAHGHGHDPFETGGRDHTGSVNVNDVQEPFGDASMHD